MEKEKNKKKIIVLVSVLILFLVILIIVIINRDKIDLSQLMGNSTTSSDYEYYCDEGFELNGKMCTHLTYVGHRLDDSKARLDIIYKGYHHLLGGEMDYDKTIIYYVPCTEDSSDKCDVANNPAPCIEGDEMNNNGQCVAIREPVLTVSKCPDGYEAYKYDARGVSCKKSVKAHAIRKRVVKPYNPYASSIKK